MEPATMGFLMLGISTGVISGIFGIGGGIIIVPALLFFFGFTQHQAQATTLALMLPPTTILAVYPYYKAGHVDIMAAVLVCIGFLAGGLLGGHVAVGIDHRSLQKGFGFFMILLGLYTIIRN
jgi:uncharacterized membrane protein YfcA